MGQCTFDRQHKNVTTQKIIFLFWLYVTFFGDFLEFDRTNACSYLLIDLIWMNFTWIWSFFVHLMTDLSSTKLNLF